jgi:hypothetical protein
MITTNKPFFAEITLLQLLAGLNDDRGHKDSDKSLGETETTR